MKIFVAEIDSDGIKDLYDESPLDDPGILSVAMPEMPEEWLDALRLDDVSLALKVLQETPEECKNNLLNGNIPDCPRELLDYCDPNKTLPMRFIITKPLHAVVFYHSRELLKLLFESGCDVLQSDNAKNNVIHFIIFAASHDIENERKYMETLDVIKSMLSESDLKTLFMAENDFTLRPLEFASFHGCFLLMESIFQTKGVYLTEEEQYGYQLVQYYDVTDYEMYTDKFPERGDRSPIFFYVFMEASRILLDGPKVFGRYPLLGWVYIKMFLNAPFSLMWFLFRVTYVVLFFVNDEDWTYIDPSQLNATHGISTVNDLPCASVFTGSNCSCCVLGFSSLIILLFDLKEFCVKKHQSQHGVYRLVGKRNYVLHLYFFRIAQALSTVCMVGLFACRLTRAMCVPVPIAVEHVLFIIISAGCVWGILYFLQVLPWLGLHAIAVQRMLQDFIKFSFIFSLFFIVFTITFRRILRQDITEGPQIFDTWGDALYSTFSVILNNVNFRDFHDTDRFSLYCLHAIFVFFVNILLLNFLIATMTSSYAYVYANRKVTFQIQCLSMAMLLQQRFECLLKHVYRKMQYSTFSERDGRLYIKHIIFKSKKAEWYPNGYIIFWDPFYWHALTVIPTQRRNYIHNKVWDEITYTFTNFNGASIEICERVSNIIT